MKFISLSLSLYLLPLLSLLSLLPLLPLLIASPSLSLSRRNFRREERREEFFFVSLFLSLFLSSLPLLSPSLTLPRSLLFSLATETFPSRGELFLLFLFPLILFLLFLLATEIISVARGALLLSPGSLFSLSSSLPLFPESLSLSLAREIPFSRRKIFRREKVLLSLSPSPSLPRSLLPLFPLSRRK